MRSAVGLFRNAYPSIPPWRCMDQIVLLTRVLPPCLIAFAGQSFERFEIGDLDNATGIADCTCRLYLTGDLGDRCPAHAEHRGEEFLREHDRVALGSVHGLQAPPADPRLEPMHRITRRADPRLCERTLVTAYTKIGNCSA